MTEKRFVRKNYSIWDNFENKEVIELNHRFQCDYMCDIMNKMSEENEQLRKENDLKSDFRNFITEDVQKIKKENKLLKEKLEDIYELTEQNGMIHLRKEQIRQIISR